MCTNFTFLMAASPQILQRAQQEIDKAFDESALSSPIPSYEQCLRLPYINACVREGLRFVASTFQRRRCLPADVPLILEGRVVPPGTSLATSGSEIGRHPRIYGENANEFVPERWLEASPEKLRLWDSLDVHWGFGGRKCLGKHVGSMVLYKSIITVRGTHVILTQILGHNTNDLEATTTV